MSVKQKDTNVVVFNDGESKEQREGGAGREGAGEGGRRQEEVRVTSGGSTESGT